MSSDINNNINNNSSNNITNNNADNNVKSKSPTLASFLSYFPSLLIVDFYYHEKILLCIDTFQCYALVWIMAQPWPWPYLWVVWTRFLVIFNLDIFSLSPTGALAGRTNNIGISTYGNMHNYVDYAMGFFVMEVVVIGILMYCHWKSMTYATRWYKYQPYIRGIGIYLSCLLYAPVTLVLFRLYVCDHNDNKANNILYLSADPSEICYQSYHLSILILFSLVHLPLIVYIPYQCYRITSELIYYELENDHEKRIQTWELMYALSVNSDYIDLQCWVLSSFQRWAVYCRYHSLLLKLYLLIVFTACRMSITWQALLSLVGIVLFYGYYGLATKDVYRCRSTSLMFRVISIVMIVNTSFGFANALQVTNFLMVSSTESLTLLIVNVVGAAMIGLIIVLSILNPLVKWPARQTVAEISKDFRANALSLTWLRAMQQSNEIKLLFLNSSPEMADIDAVEECIRVLRQCWLSASALGSIFTIALSEVMEEMIFVHSCHVQQSVRTKGYWNEAYAGIVDDKRFHRRHAHYLLMAPRKRRILTKLLSMRTLMQGAEPINERKMKDTTAVESFKKRILVSSKKQITTTSVSYNQPLVDLVAAADQQATRQEISELVNRSTEILSKDRTKVANDLQSKASGLIATIKTVSHSGPSQANRLDAEGILQQLAIFIEPVDLIVQAWDRIIALYESQKLPGMNIDGSESYSESEVETWYSYRAVLSEQLNELMNVHHQLFALEDSFDYNQNDSKLSRDRGRSNSIESMDYGDVNGTEEDNGDDLDALLGLHLGWNKHPKYNEFNFASNV